MTEQDKKIKELLKGNFDEPTPSLDFTNKIMDKIAVQEQLSANAQVVYEPIISKIGWLVIAASLLVFVFLGLSGTKESQFSLTDYIPDWHFDVSFAYSQFILIPLLSIFVLLVIDRLFLRSRLG